MPAIAGELMTIRIPAESKEWLEREAEKEGRTAPNLLRWIIVNEKQRREEEVHG